MRYSQGDIILLPYPFTDLSNTKQRPAVIISKNSVNSDNYIVAKVTSVIRNDRFSFPIHPDEIDRELRYKSEVKTNELFTIHHSIVLKRFASLNRDALSRLTDLIKENISIEG